MFALWNDLSVFEQELSAWLSGSVALLLCVEWFCVVFDLSWVVLKSSLMDDFEVLLVLLVDFFKAL